MVLFNLYVTRLPGMANIALLILLFILVPALLLTLITSGALNNLVPHRSLSVIGASSWHYWLVCVVGFVATIAFLVATVFAISSGDNFVATISGGQAGGRPGTILGMPRGLELALAPVLTFVAVVLMHVFTWQLGLVYRLHHDQFAWVLQKHDKTERNDTLAQLHHHRQRQDEARARKARENLSKRIGPGGTLPVARAVDPKR